MIVEMVILVNFRSIEIWPISSNTKYIFKESNKVYLPKDYSDKKIECYSDAIKIVARNDKYIGFVKNISEDKFYLIPKLYKNITAEPLADDNFITYVKPVEDKSQTSGEISKEPGIIQDIALEVVAEVVTELGPKAGKKIAQKVANKFAKLSDKIDDIQRKIDDLKNKKKKINDEIDKNNKKKKRN